MQVINVNLDALASAKDWYINPGFNCRIIGAYTALNTAVTTGDSTITISNGTTTVGVITITQSGCAVGDIDLIAWYDKNGSACSSTGLDPVGVKFGPGTNIKVSCDATPDAGAALLTLVLDEFHGA